ncbi:MAG: AAA family ATPase [Bacillota bacterium]
MDKLRIRNLRCISDTGDIEIKPLTVLVGKNSSGKSTFLRSFPLLKQTIETKRNEPILWYSSNYVDFGSFEESINKKTKDTIAFEFEFCVKNDAVIDETYTRYMYNRPKYITNSNLLNKFRVSVESKKMHFEVIKLHYEDNIIEICFKNKDKISELRINNREFDAKLMSVDYRNYYGFLPKILYKNSELHKSVSDLFFDYLYDTIKGLSHSATKEDTIRTFVHNIVCSNSVGIFDSVKRQTTSAQRLRENIKNLNITDDVFQKIRDFAIGMHLNGLINLCNRYLEFYYSSVKYIAPLRASAQRYYRVQGLNVDEVDPLGQNIPMILQNMSEKEKDSFNKWVSLNFNFVIDTITEGGHTSLKIRYKGDNEAINFTDTGFGYSQILPIILLLWQSQSRYYNPRSRLNNLDRMFKRITGNNGISTIVIEQPELHLHPSLQARLVDAFAQIILLSINENYKLNIIIETHSETIINRIGYIIAKNLYNFSNEYVNVLIFNQNSSNLSNIEATGYSNKGYLSKWPIGFFSPEDL